MSLDDDVSVHIERLRRARHASLKDIVNEALRRGLLDMSAQTRKRKSFRTRAFHMGKPLVSIGNVADALAHQEGESFK